jgi:serine phosphatase RsbU (regulator of sigma subunit)
MRKKGLFLLLLIGFNLLIKAQTKRIDSLAKAIFLEKNDSIKAFKILDLIQLYIPNKTSDSIEKYANLAEILAIRLNLNQVKAKCLQLRASVALYKGSVAKAMDLSLKSLKIAEAISYKECMTSNYDILGMIYKHYAQYKKALEYYYKSLQLSKELNLPNDFFFSYNNIALVYEKLNNVDSANYYFQKSYLLAKRTKNLDGLSLTLLNIGNNLISTNNFNAGIDTLKKAIEIRSQLGDKLRVCAGYNLISIAYNDQLQWKLSIEYALKSLEIAKQIGELEEQRTSYELLCFSYKGQKNYEKALDFTTLFIELTDSIYIIENYKQLSDTKTQYEVDKKEIELNAQSKLEKEKLSFTANEKSKRLQLIIVFVALALIVAAFLAVYMRKRYKISQQQKQVIEEKSKKITDSLNYAQKIQNSILPNTEQIKQYLPESFIFLKPKDVVSGDFFYLNYTDNKSFIAVVDCTGHGVPGAFMSMIGHTLLNEIIMAKKIHQANLILNELHRSVYKELQQGLNNEQAQDGMDIALCVYDHTTSELQFSGARNALYILEHGAVTLVKGDAKSIGGLTLRGEAELERNFSLQRLTITHQTKLFMSSDGYLDQINTSSNQKFGNKQFIDLLESFANKGMNECGEIIASTFEKWKQEEPQMDDVLVLGCKIG